MIVRQTNGLRLKTELVDKINPTKNRYKERPIFDLVSFSNEKIEEYVYLTVVTTGDRNGSPILVYQINGPIVTLEKVTDFVYKYKDPEDEIYTERLFEAEVIIDNLESKKKQVKVVSDPSVYYLTSQIYPINLIEEAYTSSKGISGRILTSSDLRLFQSIFEDSFTSISRITGIFKQSLFMYDYKDTDNNIYEPLRLNINRVSGVLRQLLLTYTTVPENLKTSLVRVTGVLRQLLINYTYYIPETLKTGVNKLNGSGATFTPYHEIFINGNTIDYNPNDSDNGVTVIERTVSAVSSTSVNDNGVVPKTYSTSALDFENGLIDKIPSIIWNKSGTADVTSVNKIFGQNSFETKAIGDSLYTNSNLITGGSTPFTIEFYALVKTLAQTDISTYINIISGDHLDYTTNGQGLYLHKTNKTIVYYRYIPDNLDMHSNLKISFNDINKITMTYDGACIRVFINDDLDIIVGTSSGFIKRDFVSFFKSQGSGSLGQIFGLVDNVNIHDGIATKVRDPDPYEENLIVDLAFDGENNSTRIVDNGTLKSEWAVNGNAKISTNQKFDGYSSLYIPDFTSNITSNINFNFSNDWTISFQFKSNIEPDSQVHTAFFKNTTNDFMFGVMNNGSYHKFQFIKNSIIYEFDYTTWFSNSSKVHNITIIKNENIYSLYINNVFIENKNFNIGNNFSDNISIIISPVTGNGRSFIGYYKNFKIYKDVAVIPEDPTGKIQLDFDNNVNDKYGNSTWTNNGVTFDQVNSVKDHSGYFGNDGNRLQTGINSNFNFENSNFNLSMDCKTTSYANNNSIIFSSPLQQLIYGRSSGLLATYHPTTSIDQANYIGVNINTVLNQYYNINMSRQNNVSHFRINNVLVASRPLISSAVYNFNEGNSSAIGCLPSGQANHSYRGYIDNFNSYKDIIKNAEVYSQNNEQPFISHDILKRNSNSNAIVVRFNDSPKVTSFICELEIDHAGGGTIGLLCRTNYWSFSTQNTGLYIGLNPTLIQLGTGSNSSSNNWNSITPGVSGLTQATGLTKYKIVLNSNVLQIYRENILVLTHNGISHYSNIQSEIGCLLGTSTPVGLKSIKLKDITTEDEIWSKIFESSIKTIIDKPSIHLPLETNSTNTGFTPLTINSVGNPTYTTVDGKKCIKFESGKYLTINNNNIFNLGANSDFYIEFDFYPIKDRPAFVLFCSGSSVVDSNLFTITCAELFLGEYNKVYTHLAGTNYIFPGSFIYDSWNNLIIFRKGNITTYVLNDLSISFNNDMTFNYASNSNLTYIGNAAYASTIYYNGYMSNFKMFVGTSEIPETYNDKAVLDLDFKPTRKSYLFKDNNNKCVIHPVNITQRDYQDSQYCCTFNGTDQYLQLGKNDLLNFGNDDFMIYIKFKPLSISTIKVLLNSGETSSVENRFGILLNTNGTIFIHTQYNGNYYYFSTSNSVILNEINHLVVYKQNGQLYVVLNNITTTNSILNNYLINLNVNGNTYVGFRAISDSPFYFNGQIYSIKVLRNTTDTSVLNLPILNTPSTIYLPLIKDSIDIKTGATWTNNASRVVYENEAAKFDGNSATYLNTGVTSDFNYATNDFTVGFDTYKSGNQSEARILSSMANNPSIYPRTEIKQSQGMGLTLSNYTNSSEVMYKTYKTGDVLNNWNKSRFIKTNNTLYTYINDSLVDMVTVPNGTQFNLNTNNGTRISGVGYTASSSYFYQGYIKNVYSNNTAATSDILPYLYMPYDTSLTDFGVNNLSITNSTTSASVLDTLNGVKCTRITTVSTNPYITMTLGSVFTIKAKIYIPTKASSGYHKPLFGTGYNSNIGFLLSQFTEPWSGNANPQLWLRTSGSNISFAINGLIGTWIDIIVTKTLTTLTLNVNGVDVGSMNNSNWNNSDFESSRTFYIGDAGTDWKESSTFYIKDFRFYKGLPSIPTNEVLSKKVLDLKFKKDDARVYPFKDESRRHIVSYNAMSKYNLVNIEGVDCAQFNGIDQYLELGNTKLMNFGNEDFVIAFKIYIIPYVHTGSSQWQVILASGGTSPSSNVSYIAYDQTTKSLVIRATDNEVYRISNVLNEYAWNTIIITRTGDKFNTIINNNINNGAISSTANFNLNYNANTYIGIDKWNTSNEYLKGYLADLQIVKGSSDTSLIDVNTTETITIVNPPKAIYYPIKLNEVDSFSNSWYQTNATNPVRLKEYNKGVNTSMYFDGISGLQSNNTFNRIGLSPFTVECSILIDSPINVSYPMSIFSYGKDYNRPEWFNLEVTSTGVIRFCINKSTNEYVSSPVATINYNTKYNIAVTRDADYNLRIFVNGVIIANQVVTNCFDSYSQNSGYSYTTSSNWLVIGKQGPYWNRTDPSLGGFKGNIENFHYLVGTCKYTSNYTPSINETIKLETMSLVNADVAMGTNPSTIPDTRNNIVYTNNGCTVEALAGQLRPYSIRCQTTSNRLISSVNEIMFNLGTLNWTIDLTFRPMQTSAEAYLLDTRANSTIFRGLVIRQPQTNPTTLMIEIGSSNAASAFENTYQTAANSLVVNTTYHLRLVRCIDVILVFWNGTLLTTINYGVKDIGYSNKIILFNNDLFTKGFNGYVTQFRFIKGISTDVFAFPQITQELK